MFLYLSFPLPLVPRQPRARKEEDQECGGEDERVVGQGEVAQYESGSGTRLVETPSVV